MLLRLLLLFTLIPLLELMLLIKIGARVGVLETIAGVILMGIAGAWLVKLQGLRVLNEIRGEIAQGHLPADRLLDGAIILVAGVLMITPGVLSDLAAFVLLLPPARALVRRLVKARLRARFIVFPGSGFTADDGLVDVEGRPVEPPEKRLPL